MSRFFRRLADERKLIEKTGNDQLIKTVDYAERAWDEFFQGQSRRARYQKQQTGHGRPCPHFCLKIPTGGGKTLLAGHAVHQYYEKIAKAPAGLVLWVVPSEQIYTQTWAVLTDRSHPLRKLLDAVSGQRVKILNKKSRFSPDDIENNLSILLLMLQSFSRKETKKEKYKIFQDNSKFAEFFPPVFDRDANESLLEEYPNLDYGDGLVLTSLANTIKRLRPLVILDEGHKAKSDLASSAIAECNPAAVVELTATPTEQANVLFSVAGRRLAEEEMIKLDLHAVQVSGNWKATLDAGVSQLAALDEAALAQQKKTGQYIRPICVIQAQFTGKDQRRPGNLHAEDIREYLEGRGVCAPDAIRVKSSSTNEIEKEDLLSSQSPVRYIITKAALQEGWDCPFAYVLVALAPSRSRRSLTQLIGRVLRQPKGRKTGNSLLDESYVFIPEDYNADLLGTIREGFEYDGLGDMLDRVRLQTSDRHSGKFERQKLRRKFGPSLKEFKLPAFVVQENGRPRLLKFSRDILPWIDFDEVSLASLSSVTLPPPHTRSRSISISYTATDREERNFLEERARERLQFPLGKTPVGFWVRGLLDLVPNPWVAHGIIVRATEQLRRKNSEEAVQGNPHTVLNEVRTVLEAGGEEEGEINRLARKVFEKRRTEKEIQFVLFFASKDVLRPENYPIEENIFGGVEKNLYEPIIAKSLNEFEGSTIRKLEDAERTYWWYRNQARNRNFYLAGWRQQKFYPDFIVTANGRGGGGKEFSKIVVVETKGDHLLGNEDSAYKKDLIDLFNRTNLDSDAGLGLEFQKKELRFLFLDTANLSSQIHEEFSG